MHKNDSLIDKLSFGLFMTALIMGLAGAGYFLVNTLMEEDEPDVVEMPQVVEEPTFALMSDRDMALIDSGFINSGLSIKQLVEGDPQLRSIDNNEILSSDHRDLGLEAASQLEILTDTTSQGKTIVYYFNKDTKERLSKLHGVKMLDKLKSQKTKGRIG